VAIAIKRDSPGPVIFKQQRVGKDGKTFTMYKFRTMVVNAEEILDELLSKNEADGPVFKIKEDPRVTKSGKWLRKTSIDELPQLWNVLKGDMSLVGPRPPLEREVVQYDNYQRQRLSVKPGITCYWQVSGRSNTTFDEWVELDIKYIQEQSLWTDIKLLFKTIGAVLRKDGAY
jgi:lipopolysaccharide/colanic/teichoic acid biosynthesis glycosyltransferase